MATLIVMPRLSPTMEEGVLAKWLKKEGDKINPGDLIAEVETDKANMDFPLEDEGVLLKLLVPAGATVKLGAPVAILGEKGEDTSQLEAEAQGGGQPEAQQGQAEGKQAQSEGKEAQSEGKQDQSAQQKPQQDAGKKEAGASQKDPQRSPQGGETSQPATRGAQKDAKEESKGAQKPQQDAQKPQQEAQKPAAEASQPAAGGRIAASPLAKRLAGDAGIELRGVEGSGPGGRIVKRDVEQAMSRGPAEKSAQAEKAAAPQAERSAAPQAQGLAEGDELVQLSMMRRTVAKRLTEAKQSVPHFYLTSEAPMDEALRFREKLNAASVASGGEKVSVNDLVLKALARALRVVPAANMSIAPDGAHAIKHGRIDISVAVALEEGLITPIVRRADQKALGAIAREVKELAGRARDKKLRPEEYTGGTFGLTNLGMFGIREFFAIINPPESGILAVGRTEKRPVVVEVGGRDEVRIEQRMTLTLSCDHRIIDGALGAKLLAEVVRGLAEPMLLVL